MTLHINQRRCATSTHETVVGRGRPTNIRIAPFSMLFAIVQYSLIHTLTMYMSVYPCVHTIWIHIWYCSRELATPFGGPNRMHFLRLELDVDWPASRERVRKFKRKCKNFLTTSVASDLIILPILDDQLSENYGTNTHSNKPKETGIRQKF